MGKRSTFTGYIRQRGATASSSSSLTGPTPAVSLLVTPDITFDATQASTTGTGVYLPAGAVPTFAKVTGANSTGGAGTNTVDVGLAGGNADALIAEGDADTQSAAILTSGTSLDVALTADAQITAGAGAVAATGGTVSVRVYYYMSDDGVIND